MINNDDMIIIKKSIAEMTNDVIKKRKMSQKNIVNYEFIAERIKEDLKGYIDKLFSCDILYEELIKQIKKECDKGK